MSTLGFLGSVFLISSSKGKKECRCPRWCFLQSQLDWTFPSGPSKVFEGCRLVLNVLSLPSELATSAHAAGRQLHTNRNSSKPGNEYQSCGFCFVPCTSVSISVKQSSWISSPWVCVHYESSSETETRLLPLGSHHLEPGGAPMFTEWMHE